MTMQQQLVSYRSIHPGGLAAPQPEQCPPAFREVGVEQPFSMQKGRQKARVGENVWMEPSAGDMVGMRERWAGPTGERVARERRLM